MKATRTWILIADGAHARVLEAVGKGGRLHEVSDMRRSAVLAATHELGNERPGRSHESVGDVRHAVEPKSDAHREQKRRFASEIADLVAAQRVAERFDRLVIVAPPVTLGDLRAAMPSSLQGCVMGEVPKDLTKVPDHEVLSHLGELII
jgi:protein required for attachment to host cells